MATNNSDNFAFFSLHDYVTNKGGNNKCRIIPCEREDGSGTFPAAMFPTNKLLKDGSGKHEMIFLSLSKKLTEKGVTLDMDFMKNNVRNIRVTESLKKDGTPCKFATMFLEGDDQFEELDW